MSKGFNEGYQAGVVHTLDVLREFLISKGVSIPWGFNDAALELLDSKESV